MYQVWETRALICRMPNRLERAGQGQGSCQSRRNRVGKRIGSRTTACTKTQKKSKLEDIDICTLSLKKNFIVPIFLTLDKAEKSSHALIDSGASLCFINGNLARKWNLPLIELERPKRVLNVEGKALGKIWHAVELPIRINEHKNMQRLYVCNTGSFEVVIGLDWLQRHNPDINW